MGEVRSNTPIRRARLRISDPVLGVEASWQSWMAAAIVGAPSFFALFWLVYGLLTAVGGSWVMGVVMGFVSGAVVGGVLAVAVGVVVERVVTVETPIGHHLAVFSSELSAPHLPDEQVTYAVTAPPPPLSAPRRGRAPLPHHFEKENACVRTECLDSGQGRVDRGP